MTDSIKDVAVDALDFVEQPEQAVDFIEYDQQLEALPSDEQLRLIGEKGALLLSLKKELEVALASTQSLSNTIKELEEVTLPEMMQKVGLTSVTLLDGTKLEVGDEVYASIPEASQPQTLHWMRTNNFGPIIKNQVSLSFGKGEDDKASYAYAQLVASGFEPERKEFVHPQTLKAFVKEQDKKGKPVPDNLFSVHRTKKIKVKLGN